MKKSIILILMVLFLILPFAGATPEKRSLDITSLVINFDKTDATFAVNYDLGKLSKMYVLLFGSKSIEPRINAVFSNFDYEIIKMDQSKAILRVKSVSRLDKGYYLHDSRKLGTVIDKITVYTPDSPRPTEYYALNSTPNKFYRQ